MSKEFIVDGYNIIPVHRFKKSRKRISRKKLVRAGSLNKAVRKLIEKDRKRGGRRR